MSLKSKEVDPRTEFGGEAGDHNPDIGAREVGEVAAAGFIASVSEATTADKSIVRRVALEREWGAVQQKDKERRMIGIG